MSLPLTGRATHVAPQAAAHLRTAVLRILVGLLFFGLAGLLTQTATLATAWLWLLAALLQGWGLGCVLYGAGHLYHAWRARQGTRPPAPGGGPLSTSQGSGARR